MIDVDALLEAHVLTQQDSPHDVNALAAATSYAVRQLQAAVGEGVPTHEQLIQFTLDIALGADYLFDL